MDAHRPAQHDIRPSFELTVDAGAQEVLDRLRDYLDHSDFGCRGWVAPPYAELEVQAATKQLWSPRLAIYSDDEDGRCTLHCRFQPEPGVWTMYMAAWAMLAVGGACGVAWTCARWLMGASIAAPVGWVVAAGALALALYLLALGGQRLGKRQMRGLRDALQTAVATRRPQASRGPGDVS